MPLDNKILGKGVYTPREAARLVRTSPQQILRWTRGSGTQEPLWNAYYQFIDEEVTELSFLDLVELRVVAAMRKAGISLQSIRFAISFAQEKLGIDKPLASRDFKTDGTEILMDALENDGQFVSLSRKRPGQKVFREIISQSLNDLEYEDKEAARWRPNNFQAVVIDPDRHFGEPILDKYGISTRVLISELDGLNSIGELASLYEIPRQYVEQGIKFERNLDETHG